ncbi:MAG: S8 family serine peptidase [Richelia sp. RM2_1_2]|nr:S8 family serine peptidase [Richelia sp. RM2_1_2]
MAGKVTSHGDRAMRSDIARELFEVDGTGIKIGVISTSFNALNGLEADVKSGDLPGEQNPSGKTVPVTILKDLANTSPLSNDEGRALAQIIHDIAPGAEIYFHSVVENEGETSLEINEEGFTNAVSSLIAEDVDIIIDDSVIPAPIFQDGVAAEAVQKATDEGIIFITAAGNNGNIAYESEFRPGETFTLGENTFEAHDYDPGSGIDVFQNIEVTEDGTGIRPLLTWDEPIGNVGSGYTMFLLNSPELPSLENIDNIASISILPSLSADDDPLRTFFYPPEKDETLYLLIARESTNPPEADTIKWVSYANGLDRTTNYEYIDKDSVNRTVFGQANAPTAITVGASDVNNPQDVRTYTSRGGSPILFDTEGNRLSSPVLREKPEIFAPDGVETTFSSDSSFFNPFEGTSASAPHVAGVVALMLERAGATSPEDVRSILQETSLPLTENAGFVQADNAIIGSFISEHTGTENDDILQGSEEADNLYGQEGNNILLGENGKDYLSGGSGTDILLGGEDNDVLLGNGGKNILSGGTGKDTFWLNLKGFSLITDFEIEKDSLAFSEIEDAKNLTFSQMGHDTFINYSGESIAMILGVEVDANVDITFV